MRTLTVKAEFREYDSPGDLPGDDRALLDEARKIMVKAHAPYSGFHVGAALRLANGVIVSGNNQENAAYPSGLCAERVAAFAASANHPGVEIVAMAVVARTDRYKVNAPVSPCGACRQVLLEYEQPGKPIRVLLSGETGPVLVASSISDLLPLGFSRKDLGS